MLQALSIGKPRYYDWKKRQGIPNQHNGHIPKNSWISPEERKAILNYYQNNPLNGCRRLSYMMMDENIAYVSSNTVYRVLKSKGLIDEGQKGSDKKGKGYHQPKSIHQEWHIDISYINAGGTFYYLCTIIDGYSRFLVHYDIKESMKEYDVELVVQKALELHQGFSPRLISDNGPQFKSKDFKKFIKLCGMSHTFISPYYPQSNGKMERWYKELKSTCIRPLQPRDLEEAKKYINQYIDIYNYKRLHSSLGYITPFDKLLGLESELFTERKLKLKLAKNIRKEYWKNQNVVNELANVV